MKLLINLIEILIITWIITLLVRGLFRHCEDFSQGHFYKQWKQDRKHNFEERLNNPISYTWSFFSDWFFIFGLVIITFRRYSFFDYFYTKLSTMNSFIGISLIFLAIGSVWRSFCDYFNITNYKDVIIPTKLRTLGQKIFFIIFIFIAFFFIAALCYWVFNFNLFIKILDFIKFIIYYIKVVL